MGSVRKGKAARFLSSKNREEREEPVRKSMEEEDSLLLTNNQTDPTQIHELAIEKEEGDQ